GLLPRAGLDDEEAGLRKDGRQGFGETLLQGRELLVGRVDEHEIVAPAGGGLVVERGEYVLAEDAGAGQAELLEVAVDRPAGVAVVVDEEGAGRAARERLEAERARAGEQVEHRGAVDRADQVERGLADAVARRARVRAGRREDAGAAAAAGDDPHGEPGR